MTLGPYVGGDGSSSAKLVVCGEAPGAEEERNGLPFVGQSGQMVRAMIKEAGIHPEEVYYTNVVKHRPPDNDIHRLKEYGKRIEDYDAQLWEEIYAIKPNAILAFGGTALNALTGETGIEKWRGSILQSRHGFPKVISTIHPAAILHKESDGKMRSWKDKTFIQWDVNRAVYQSKFQELIVPKRNILICKNSLDLYRFLNSATKYGSVDIETFRTIPQCVGIAFNRYEAMSVPLFNIMSARNPNGIGRSDMLQIWKMLAEYLCDPNFAKIGQNFKFDEGLLDVCYNRTLPFGMKVRGFHFDTQLGFRTLYPELPAKLQFISSVLTEMPYYKDEGKEYNPKKDKLDRWLIYNGKDAVVTYECFENELKELQEAGLEDFFFNRVMPLHPFYSRIEGRGILRDVQVQKELDRKYQDHQKRLEEELLELTGGIVVNVMSNGQRGQVAALLFGVLKIPVRKGTDEETLNALLRNVVKDSKKKRIIEVILELRKVRKTRGTYINAKSHPDGRLRTGYRIVLETGRTSTSVLKAPVTTEPMGMAFQTITKHGDVGSDLRSMFIPDPGYVFLEPDLSQAESRVVALLARDERALKLFKYGVDIHRVTYSWIAERAIEFFDLFLLENNDALCKEMAKQINKALKDRTEDWERQMGKKFRHAGERDMHKKRASEMTGLSEWRAGKILEKFHLTNSGIRDVYFKEIRECLQENNRILRSPFGRQRQFLNKWGEDLFREAYSELPQNVVSDQVKYAAQRTEKRIPAMMILQESHDSYLCQVPIGIVDRCLPIIKEELEQPIDFSKCSLPRGELIIPCEIGFSTLNWEKMEKIV